MRHCLVVFLLVFLPFQFSWAAVGAYCEHETGKQAQHFGHHEHEHRQVVTKSAEQSKFKSSALLDVADCHLHCQCVADMPAWRVVPMVIGNRQPVARAEANATAPSPSRPERPQWVGHA